MSLTNSSNNEILNKASFISDDDANLVGFGLSTMNSASNMNLAMDADLVSYGYLRESLPSKPRNIVTCSSIVMSIAAIGLGFVIGKSLR